MPAFIEALAGYLNLKKSCIHQGFVLSKNFLIFSNRLKLIFHYTFFGLLILIDTAFFPNDRIICHIKKGSIFLSSIMSVIPFIFKTL
jgi:hypothetical protein